MRGPIWKMRHFDWIRGLYRPVKILTVKDGGTKNKQ